MKFDAGRKSRGKEGNRARRGDEINLKHVAGVVHARLGGGQDPGTAPFAFATAIRREAAYQVKKEEAYP